LSTDAAQQVDALLTKRDVSTTSVGLSAATTKFPSPSQPPSAVTAPVPPSTEGTRVRALYDYNNPGDLCFRSGDIIELTPSPDDNADWWTGKLNGQTGLFPSNHVTKIAPSSQPFGVHTTVVQTAYSYHEKPPGPPPHSYAPPYQPPGPAYNPPPPPPASTVIVQQETPEPSGKQSRFGNLGNTMANSAAGGVGFGAGAAVGSGLINAIF